MTITSVSQLAAALQPLFGALACRLARETGFVRRQRRLDGASFAQALVFGWLARPCGSVEHLARTSAAADCPVTAQALQQRWTPAAALFLHQLLEAAVALVVAGRRTSLSLLNRFAAVVVIDSSTLSLPAVLAPLWRGCGGGHRPEDGQAAVKVSVAYDLVAGALLGLRLAAGRTHDRAAAPDYDVPRGSLLLRDRGYFSVAGLQAVAAAGNYYLSRVQAGTVLWCEGQRHTLSHLVRQLRLRAGDPPRDLALELGAEGRLPVRGVVWRVTPAECRRRRAALRKQAKKKGQPVSAEALVLAGYHVLVTNAPADLLTAEEAHELYRARWQIELLFKLWKSVAGLAASRSRNPWRVLCEVYAKLLGALCAHWFMLAAGVWEQPERSLTKAFQAVQTFAMAILLVLSAPRRLARVLRDLARTLSTGCSVNPRRHAPSSVQRLRTAAEGGLT